MNVILYASASSLFKTFQYTYAILLENHWLDTKNYF